MTAANDLKKEIRSLLEAAPESLDLARLMRRLANHDAAVRMLAAGNRPPVDPDDLRPLLARLEPLLRHLQEWADPAARNRAVAEKRKSAPAADAATLEAALETRLDDPSVLRDVERVKVFTDGGSKGNPGPASIGVVVQDVEGRTLYEHGRCIGRATNNVAEYTALISALKTLVENGAPEAYCFADSELMVKQMNGEYKVKNAAIQPLVAEAQRLRRRLPRFQIVHVPRAQNKRADELGNLAMKQARDAGTI